MNPKIQYYLNLFRSSQFEGSVSISSVIQVEAGGEYAGIQWTRTPIALNFSNGELLDFQQAFVRTVTSEQDWGLYQATLCTLNCTQSLTLMFSISAVGNTSCKWYCSQRTLALCPILWIHCYIIIQHNMEYRIAPYKLSVVQCY